MFVFLGGIGAAIASVVVVGQLGGDELTALVVSALVQQVVWLAGVIAVSHRRGTGSLGNDFGLHFKGRDWSGFFSGIGWQILIGLALTVLVAGLGIDDPPPQEVVDFTQGAIEEEIQGADAGLDAGERARAVFSSLPLLGLIASIVLVAPFAEELLFRGLLLRSLLARLPEKVAIGISALAFGIIHLSGPITIAAIGALGAVLAVRAVRDGRLGRAVFMHVGFNTLTVVVILNDAINPPG